jgi:hypothetical protein
MGGKKGRSGPPGNVNAAIRPWRSFWRRRALRPADAWVARALEAYAAALESDKADATETERLMMQNAQTARGAAMLILAEAARSGFIRRLDATTWDVQPGVKELVKFLSAERSALQVLGLARRSKDVDAFALSPAEWVAHQDARESSRDAGLQGAPATNDTGAGQGDGGDDAPR